jgi:glucose/arabinose dehydrogenase
MRNAFAIAFALSGIGLVAGCGESPPADVDSGSGTDAGRDSGGGGVDADDVDSGTTDVDSGTTDVDSGMAEMDSGTIGVDAPIVLPDTGVDSGMTMVSCTAPIPALTAMPITTTMFSSPVHVAQPPGSTDLYVVQRGGLVRIVRGGTVLGTPFINLSSRLGGTPTGGAEWGLLSIAFHPNYATNGRFFVGFTPNGGDNIVAEGTRSAGSPDVANPTVTDLVTVPDFAGNHNGGLVMFGPDGYLYAGMGDGGGGGDPGRTAQDMNDLLGKILRLDVSVPGVATVPATNPFVGMAGVRGEIWSYGLRNPWRFSFDRANGDLSIGDVGLNAWEEIDYDAATGSTTPGGRGDNYGWSRFEGTRVYTGAGSGEMIRGPSPHSPPITEYPHSEGSSVVGGYVYRGTSIAGLQGVYLFGDSYDGWVRAMRVCSGTIMTGPVNVPGLDSGATFGAGLVSFGEDNAGELYLVYLSGEVMRVM